MKMKSSWKLTKIGKQFDRWQYNNKHLQIVEEENSQQQNSKYWAKGWFLEIQLAFPQNSQKSPCKLGGK